MVNINITEPRQFGWNGFTNPLDDNEVKVGERRVIEVIVSAMKTHINNPGVCKLGCCAFMNITINGKCQHHKKVFFAKMISQTRQMAIK